MTLLKNTLNTIAFILTLVLLVYGFSKGYDMVELSLYNIYFIVIIITQIINIFE